MPERTKPKTKRKPLLREIKAMAKEGRKIEAIKAYRYKYGVLLWDAKKAVEKMMAT